MLPIVIYYKESMRYIDYCKIDWIFILDSIINYGETRIFFYKHFK